MNDDQNSNSIEEKYHHFERPTMKRPPSLINLTLWTIFVGLLAGFGGYLLANYILPADTANYFNINSPGRDIKIEIDQPMVNIGNQHQKSVAGVYRNVRVNASIGQALYSKEDFLGSAVVVTSDGWLMTTNQVTSNDAVSIILGDKQYEVEDIQIDEFSGLVFLKINEDFLQPVNFQLTDNVKIGEKLFTSIDVANAYDHTFTIAYLSNPHYSLDKYLFTDSIDYFIRISDIDGQYKASPYFNLDGDLVGLSYNVSDETLLIPAEYIKQSVKHLLNGTERSSLGIRYVDMENNSGFDRRGSLVYSPQYAPVVYNSPAYQAGIKSGDQIVAVNNDMLSTYRSLTSVLQNYRSGDVVIIKILRDGQEQDLEITL